jgi:hypothetical protein
MAAKSSTEAAHPAVTSTAAIRFTVEAASAEAMAVSMEAGAGTAAVGTVEAGTGNR